MSLIVIDKLMGMVIFSRWSYITKWHYQIAMGRFLLPQLTKINRLGQFPQNREVFRKLRNFSALRAPGENGVLRFPVWRYLRSMRARRTPSGAVPGLLTADNNPRLAISERTIRPNRGSSSNCRNEPTYFFSVHCFLQETLPLLKPRTTPAA